MATATHEIIDVLRHPEHGLLLVGADVSQSSGGAGRARVYYRLVRTAGGMLPAQTDSTLQDLSRAELADLDSRAPTPESPRTPRDWGGGMEVGTTDPTTGGGG